ncbi:dihydrofolate reductase family protein [Paeniglutamicibacter psychrophenolicus]|uniref:dihydrofolate reductase family protein n=1 Tax=Paeniglutamicibacter psychrophenolicus TaxID=257454 RepID=UPI0027840DD3|nr:dihydrofolate reductase family protein [Paeniglutamicibacter psychrophenolicus]MDQ0095329.1 riboflavin biosynthesis pyrimidine reductase [Paeniglutamicibacter psychrophenolicus]
MRRLLPDPAADPDDGQLLDWYAPGGGTAPFVRFNFVSSTDGAASIGGLSGALGTAADKRVFMLLRRLADAIVVGAGTVRAEGYEGELLDADSRAWRLAHGMPERPLLVVVSGRLDLDAHSELFTRNPGKILVLASGSADRGRAAALGAVAEVVSAQAPGPVIDPRWIIETLHARGLRVLHSEGGPTLLADFQRADALDSLCVTYSPVLAGGEGPRIARGRQGDEPRHLGLHLLLEQDGTLLAEYRRR